MSSLVSNTARLRDSVATREALLEAAEAIFAEQGFSGARVDQIAQRSGYNKSLIFMHFSDKLGLYHRVLHRIRDTSDDAFREVLGGFWQDPASWTQEEFQNFIVFSAGWVFDHFLARPHYLQLLTWEMASGWPVFRNEESGPEDTSFGRCVELFKRARVEGWSRPDLDPQTLAETMLCLPLVTLASLPRFQAYRSSVGVLSDLVQLRVQIVTQLLHIALPDDKLEPA